MSSISTVKNINPLRRVATKNTAVALPRTITAIKITGVLASFVAVEAAQGKTRNLQSMSMSMLLKTEHITTMKNGIDEAAGIGTTVEMEPIRLEDVADEGALITSDDDEPISILSVLDKNAGPEEVISIIMKATGIDDADIKERVVESMPDKTTLHSLSTEKKCKLFRFIFGHSYFHGVFEDFLEKVCPFTCPGGSPSDDTVAQGGCCETDAQCSSKSALFSSLFLFYYITCFLFAHYMCIKQTTAVVVGMGTFSAMTIMYVNVKKQMEEIHSISAALLIQEI